MKDPAEAGGSVATKMGSGESRGQKRANQRCNRRFFGVLPETRSTGETTRTKTDGSLSSEISDSGNERNKQRKIGGNTRWKTQTNKREKERRKLLRSSGRTVSCHARRVRRVRREREGKREGGVISLRESGRMVCGRTRRIRRDEGMGLKGTKTQRHRWVMARLRDSRWARPSSVAQRRRKGREEQRSSVKRCGSKTESLLDQNVEPWGRKPLGKLRSGRSFPL